MVLLSLVLLSLVIGRVLCFLYLRGILGHECFSKEIKMATHTTLAAALIVLPLAFTNTFAYAEGVFRWVDDTGKVHFSDSTHKNKHEQNKQQRVNAQAITLQPVNRADPSDGFSDVYKTMKSQNINNAKPKSQAQAQQQAMRKNRDSLCKEWVAHYNKFGRHGMVNTYMIDKTGKSLSEQEQQKALIAMRQKLTSKGCL